MASELRWKLRYSSYCKALSQLNAAVEQESLNNLEKQGLIQCFEYTFELAWKTMKDYLEQEGFTISSPRNAIQTAYQNRLIEDGHAWIKALEHRNLMSRTYDEAKAEDAVIAIKTQYVGILNQLETFLEKVL